MQKVLEETFDIPFVVKKEKEKYIVYPDRNFHELFRVEISLRMGVRIISEIFPGTYSKNMLEDISNANKEKIELFKEYLRILEKESIYTILINDNPWELGNDWITWNSFYFKFSKIIDENDSFENVALEYARKCCGLMLSLLNVVPIEETYFEGKKSQVLTNRYERNPLNRQICLEENGYICKICGFDFENMYGEIGHHFIHVHHVTPVSKMGGEYILNPKKDLIPVCPNCHAMLHSKKEPLKPDELIQILKERGKIGE